MIVKVTIPGEPVAQGRGRVGVVKLAGGGVRGSIRDPEKSRSWKAEVRFAMRQAIGGERIAFPDGPVAILLILRFAGSKSDHRKTTAAPWRWRPRKPDGSNVLKAVEDAGNGILWGDDSQIVELRVLKTDVEQGGMPGCVLFVQPAAASPEASFGVLT